MHFSNAKSAQDQLKLLHKKLELLIYLKLQLSYAVQWLALLEYFKTFNPIFIKTLLAAKL